MPARIVHVRGESVTYSRSRSKPRRERAHERNSAPTSRVLGHKLAFRTRPTLHHLDMQGSQGTDPLAATGEASFSIAPAVHNPGSVPFRATGEASSLKISSDSKLTTTSVYQFRRVLDRFNDHLITGAAANISVHIVLDLFGRGIRIFIEQGFRQ